MSTGQTGLTLVELLITLVILTVLIGIGVPGFKGTIESNRLQSQSYDISAALSYARIEAIDKGLSIALCSSTNSTSCRSDGNKNTWTDGWILFRDINANGSLDTPDCTNDNKDCILKVWNSLSGSSVLTSTTNHLVFASDGRLQSSTLSFTLTTDSPALCGINQKRTLSVLATGRLTITESDCP